MFSIGSLSTAIAAEKSPLQKQIEKESAEKRIKERDKQINDLNKGLERNRQECQKTGYNENLNQSTRDLYEKKQRLQRENEKDREKVTGKVTPPKQQPQQRGQTVQQENDRDAGHYGTFGRQGQGQYRGQQAREWNNRK
jgi:hypothetical protein